LQVGVPESTKKLKTAKKYLLNALHEVLAGIGLFRLQLVEVDFFIGDAEFLNLFDALLLRLQLLKILLF